jgi:hypothetical protein
MAKEAIRRLQYSAQLEIKSALHNKPIAQHTSLGESHLLRRPPCKSVDVPDPPAEKLLTWELKIYEKQDNMMSPKEQTF